jgi:hypothetical protein
MNKYTHSKTPSDLAVKSRRDGSTSQARGLRSELKRKEDNHATVERIFGFFTPEFGGAWGSSYNSATGAISKNYRAKAVA